LELQKGAKLETGDGMKVPVLSSKKLEKPEKEVGDRKTKRSWRNRRLVVK